MAWVAQRTWTDGETVTPSHLNVFLRDAMRYLYSPPRCSAFHPSEQAPETGGVRTLSLSETLEDNDAMHGTWPDAPANTTADAWINLRTAGRYLVAGEVEHAATATAADKSLRLTGQAITEARVTAYVTANTEWLAEIVQVVLSSVTGAVRLAVEPAAEQRYPSRRPRAPALTAHWVGS